MPKAAGAIETAPALIAVYDYAPLDSFLAFFAAFFSFGLRAGCFLFSLLLFCSLLMVFTPSLDGFFPKIHVYDAGMPMVSHELK